MPSPSWTFPPGGRWCKKDTAARTIDWDAFQRITDLVTNASPEWHVELSYPFPTEVNLIIRSVSQRSSPTFVIYQEDDGLHVDQVWHDACTTLSVCHDLVSAGEVLVQQLSKYK